MLKELLRNYKNEKENAIEVKHISKSFKIYHDKAHQLKDAVVFHNFRKKQKVEKRLILDDISFEVKKEKHWR